jgi:hypothetical protein
VVGPTFVSEIEQDYVYWPLKYRRIAAEWRANTTWGHLFQEYQRRGYLEHDRAAEPIQ